MLPRLQAEERLNAINDRAVASGAAKKHDARQMIQRLEKAARPRRGKAAKANPATLAGMGIGVVGSPSEPSQEPVNDG